MVQPTTYLRQFNFTNYQTLNPTSPTPGTSLDAEFSAVKVTLDQTLANLKLIQRDDGQIANLSIGYDQLKTEVVTGGINITTPWLTATAYTVGQCVSINNAIYRCAVAHTSGTFATDLAAGRWTLMIDLSSVGSFSSGTFTGTGAQTVYNLGVQIVDANRVIWTENGVVITPGTAYTVSGTNLTRTVAPGAGVAISWRLLGSASATFPADASVTTAKLVDQNVTTAKIADLNVTTAKLADLNVTLAKLAADSVDSSKVVANSLVFNDLQQIATQRFVGRNTAGTGDMEAVTLSQALDWIGTAAQGDLLYRDAASWNRLPAGSANQMLKTGGGAANPSWAGSMVLLASGSVSGVATLDLTIPSGYKRYVLYLDDMIPVTNNNTLALRFSFDSGATYKSAGGDYAWAGHYSSNTSTGGIFDSTSTGITSSILVGQAVATYFSTAGFGQSMVINIWPGAASKRPVVTMAGWQVNSTNSVAWYSAGSPIYNGPITNVRFVFTVGGNINTGTYALYGVS